MTHIKMTITGGAAVGDRAERCLCRRSDQDRRGDAADRHLCRHRPAGEMGPRTRDQGGQRRRRHHGPPGRTDLRGRGSQSVGGGAEGRKAVPGRQGRLPHRHRQFRRDAGGRPSRRTRRQAARDHGVVRGFDHRRQVLAQRVPRQCQGRPAVDSAGGLAREGAARRRKCSTSAPTI